ncbi:MAG: hypothetical protein IAF02_27640 [Anaerolineae bacterium]|nr:hypothetical protein [Anaerolineae bacterium]
MKNAHVQLFDQMLATFNEEDIVELCFRLAIVYDDLNGKNRRAKTISLIAYCQQAQHLPELVELCQELRPAVSWPTIAALQADELQGEELSAEEPESDMVSEPVRSVTLPHDTPASARLPSSPIKIPVWVWRIVGVLLLALTVFGAWRLWENAQETAVPIITNPSDHTIGLNQSVKGKIIGSGTQTWAYTGSREDVDIRVEGGPDDTFVLILTYQDGGQAAYIDYSGRGEGELVKYYDLQENMQIVVDETENDGAEYTLSITPSNWKYLWPGESFGGEIRGANPEKFNFSGSPIPVDIILEMTNAEQPSLEVYEHDGKLLISADQVDENGRLLLTNLMLPEHETYYEIVIRDLANDGAVFHIEMWESDGS